MDSQRCMSSVAKSSVDANSCRSSVDHWSTDKSCIDFEAVDQVNIYRVKIPARNVRNKT